MTKENLICALAVKTGSPITKLLLVKLTDSADHQGYCFPSYEYLAKSCEISVRTAKQHVNKLVELGYLTKTSRFRRNGMQRSNGYQLCLPPTVASQQYTGEYGGVDGAPITKNKNNNILEGCSSGEEVVRLLSSEGEVVIGQTFFDVLRDTYPGVDVYKELTEMRMWLYLNESKRQPANTIKYFVNTWLRRVVKVKRGQQEYSRVARQSEPQTAIKESLLAYQRKKNKHPIEARIQTLIQQKKLGAK
ncbi:hypothetical protein GT360_13540 [Vibrio astriarenae]|uniref:Helix-turn-helix domain-containing protein n=1 Tax=Vibrio astriarenae TaxID=1481923 RepID=A0A7Z2T558_9VIBR|nr:helix-turn-helix domain-containing protein [Vibrio astriarenae]QIA64450.1 hypothetical protein GT360_13540 [Vibrio astriarenae]